jgi:PPK2 family polyphosphate:nucleotide phosphotransferase
MHKDSKNAKKNLFLADNPNRTMAELSNKSTEAPGSLDRLAIEQDLKDIQARLFRVQNLLYANNNRSLLIILQGLDAAGKDSTIKHVFSCVNPMGCNVKSFKKPTEEEQRHGFLHRIYQNLPAKGMIQIFNRSHYEDILVPTVHGTLDRKSLAHRYAYINSFEDHLQKNGTIILKYFLHISEEAQLAKIQKRLSDPEKRWKYDEADEREKANRKAYIKVYEQIFKKCSPRIPWQIIPADQKWYRNYLIAKTVVEKLEALKMTYPK